MILEEETYKKFGYLPSKLKPQSHKRILAACDDCGKIRVIHKEKYRALCRSCAVSGMRNPLFGKSHSGETKRKISQNRIYTEGEEHPSWKPKVKCICLECEKEFLLKPSFAKEGRGKFCSRKCKGKWQSKYNTGENHPSFGKHLSEETKQKISEANKGKSLGKNNPAWQGGLSFFPYCSKFNEEFKQYIRTKFGNVCFLCDKTEEENGQKLSVHHCNYSKECLCDDDETCQFVPLCISCHAKVHHDRDKWERYFKNKLRNKLNGWYI